MELPHHPERALDPGDDTDDLIRRLNRIEGQLRGIGRMVEERRPCAEVMQQLAAAEGALGRIGSFVFRRHVESCVRPGMNHGPEACNQAIGSLIGLMSRLDELSAGSVVPAPADEPKVLVVK